MSPQEETVAVFDGSGVLYDPKGINRKCLWLLPRPKDVTLPIGEVVGNGTQFRNFYHLCPSVTEDFLVLYGGRSSALSLNTVEQFMYREDGRTLRFKYVVEGVSLFFTQDARQRLEDASVNKGGVTLSSPEVLATLSLSDKDYAEHIEVQKRIDLNAQFKCIWREHERTGNYYSVLTNQLSERITDLSAKVQHSGLTTKEELLKRLRGSYTRAFIASQLARRFIYCVGLGAPEFSFSEFVEELVGGKKEVLRTEC
ncbi:hypothetical protein PHYBOEH_009876 [Phytophthora boehmeriae]|uniref:Glutamate/phenylalanine/leucine/valine/L-tryptophan dehydrogenase C-terminal domain-containing protein n=1 Tax=Phytophthora boehmeriae TaxID=109152 RepID=A0A8T1VQ79_9STRA|nr:hypothetical protein PHYBOEH_009876 [Phytophthora boehmeriae]